MRLSFVGPHPTSLPLVAKNFLPFPAPSFPHFLLLSFKASQIPTSEARFFTQFTNHTWFSYYLDFNTTCDDLLPPHLLQQLLLWPKRWFFRRALITVVHVPVLILGFMTYIASTLRPFSFLGGVEVAIFPNSLIPAHLQVPRAFVSDWHSFWHAFCDNLVP